jgi:hypothetical protein
MAHWGLEDLKWSEFNPEKVEVHLLAQAKGAALVESNADDYVLYLRRVFAEDEEFLRQIDGWGEEEKLHGAALRRWCELADPSFDYQLAMSRFREAYRIPLEVQVSVRGSRARELIARCVVETGTTTYYTALRDACQEPVLREICRRIAGDEVRHFQMFLRHLNERYGGEEGLGWVERGRTILARVLEIEDPELPFAYFAANSGEDLEPRKIESYSTRYMSEVAGLYHRKHFHTAVPFFCKVAGVRPRPWMVKPLAHLAHGAFHYRYGDRRLTRLH